MTTLEMDTSGYVATRAEWLDSVASETQPRTKVMEGFRNWVTGLVYGVEAPSEATYERFPDQQCQVAFADSIPVRRSPLSQ